MARVPACLGALSAGACFAFSAAAWAQGHTPPPPGASAPAQTPAPASPDGALPPLPPPESAPAAPSAPATARAPAPASETAPEPEPEPPAIPANSPGASFEDARYRDANADRVILGSTAETHPAGTFFFSDYELLLLQIGYAITDSVQISMAGVPPIAKDQPFFADFGLKINLVRTAAFRAAITGALDVATDGDDDSNDGPFFAGRFGAAAQFCLDPHCRSSLSANAGVVVASGSQQVTPAYGSLGLIVNVSPLVSLLVEPAIGGAFGTPADSGGAVFLVSYGLRLARARWAVDLTFVDPVAVTNEGDYDNPVLLGYPFVAFTYRTEGTAVRPLPGSTLGGGL